MMVNNQISLDTSWTANLTQDLQKCDYASAVLCAAKIQLAAIHDSANHAWAAVRKADKQHALRAITHLLLLPAAPITVLIPGLIPMLNDTLGLSSKWCEPPPLGWKDRSIKFSKKASEAIISDVGLKVLTGLASLGILGFAAYSHYPSNKTVIALPSDSPDDSIGRYVKYTLGILAGCFAIKSIANRLSSPPHVPAPPPTQHVQQDQVGLQRRLQKDENQLIALQENKEQLDSILSPSNEFHVLAWSAYKKLLNFKSLYSYTAQKQILKKMSESEIDYILNKHLKFYDNWTNYTVKRQSLTEKYTNDQQSYGCLMASFSHALADQIKQKCPFSDLVDLACFGRQLMASLTNLSPFEIEKFGMRRDIEPWKWAERCTPLGPDGFYPDLGKALANLKWDYSSPWIYKNNTTIIYRGVITNKLGQPDYIDLSYWLFEEEKLIHTFFCSKSLEQAQKLFEECQLLEGEALYRRLGEFFWWWCQSKPVVLGDPSIGEMLFKAILISKGYQPPGWKENIVPWEQTIIEYDGSRFGENFSQLWDTAELQRS